VTSAGDVAGYHLGMAAHRIRTWIYGLALVSLVISGWSVSGSGVGGPASASTGAVALVLIAALIAVRTSAGLAIFRFGRAPRPAPAYARTRSNGVGRQIDPDAPGRARPRAPGCSASL
jgi:Family of unknown function (DUF6412)